MFELERCDSCCVWLVINVAEMSKKWFYNKIVKEDCMLADPSPLSLFVFSHREFISIYKRDANIRVKRETCSCKMVISCEKLARV